MDPDICRGRFIAPIADLSALRGLHDIAPMLLIRIIHPLINFMIFQLIGNVVDILQARINALKVAVVMAARPLA
jgi:hypothetical protein